MSRWIDPLRFRGTIRPHPPKPQPPRDQPAAPRSPTSRPDPFPPRLYRRNLDAVQRQDRRRLLGGLLAVLLVILALFANDFWHESRREQTRRENPPPPPLPSTGEIFTRIPWPYPYAADFDPAHPERPARLPELATPAKFTRPPSKPPPRAEPLNPPSSE